MSEDIVADLENDNAAIGRRLRKQLEGKATVVAAADAAGVTAKTMGRWLAGTSGVDVAGLLALARRYKVDIPHILSGLGPDSGDETTDGEAFVSVRMLDVEVSAGAGVEAAEVIGEVMLRFPEAWLRTMVRNVDDARLFSVTGDSQEPELRSGDLVLIDQGQTELREGLYVARLDGALLIKRVRVIGGNRIELLSANPSYGPVAVELGGATDFQVIGKAVWSGRRLA